MIERVTIETSLVSYWTARRSRDLIVAGIGKSRTIGGIRRSLRKRRSSAICARSRFVAATGELPPEEVPGTRFELPVQ